MSNHPASFNEDGVQWAWDATSLKRAWTCPRKYFYESICGWTSPYASIHLWFGRIYASSLESYHKLRAEGDDYDTALRKVVKETLIESWDHELDNEGNRIPGTGAARTFSINTTKSRETLIRSVIWYLEHFREDAYETYITAEGKAAVEFSFQLEVDNGVTLCGHNDRLCVSPENDLYIHDQKTTGQSLGPYYFKQFKPDDQFALYTFAGAAIYDTPIRGVVIDAAAIKVGFTQFGRHVVEFIDAELNEWYDETMLRIEEIQNYARKGLEETSFPRNKTACNNFGGCDFRDVCARPAFIRPAFLKGDFIKEDRWDPIQRR